MKLKVGEKYNNGLEKCVKIVLDDNTSDYPFQGDNGVWYTEDGRYNKYNSSHKENLVEFIQKQREKKLSLKCGESYIDRQNNIIKIVSYHPLDMYPFESDTGKLYTKEGHFFVRGRSDKDLIKRFQQN